MNISRELWRLRINGFLSQILMAIMYSICTTDFLASFHRFVTNPKNSANGTTSSIGFKVEPGLGESEFFYSTLMAIFNGTAAFSALLVGVLVRYIPYWYQYVFFTTTLVFGSVLYGIAQQSSTILVGMAIIGLYLGAEGTLGNSYAIKLSSKYVEVVKERGDDIDKEERTVRIRNYLYTAHTFGHAIGFTIGTGIGVLFSHLPIEQYRSASWLNVACGLVLLLVFVFFFRGESKSDCSKTKNRGNVCGSRKNCPEDTPRPGALQIFIIVSFLLLNFVETFKWAYFEVLLSPVLSDSFGMSLKVSSYFYLGLAVPRFLGPMLVAVLQRIKFSSQFIRIIGFLLSMTGYALLTDWQAIPYDPCTEYSPFHHPELFQNQNSNSIPLSNHLFQLKLNPSLRMEFSDGRMVDWNTGLEISLTCERDLFCRSPNIINLPTFDLHPRNHIDEAITSSMGSQVLACSLSTSNNLSEPIVCVSLVQDHVSNSSIASIQSLMVLPDNVYASASNSCMNALDGQCHWIPFSIITHKKCEDCPPICRGKHQTLSFTQLVIGISFLIFTSPFEWVPLLAMVSNQIPNNKKLLGVVLGAMNAVVYISTSTGPIIADALYEVTQKRTFLLSILLGSLNIPFLIEVVVLYRRLGPSKPKSEAVYTQLKEPAQEP